MKTSGGITDTGPTCGTGTANAIMNMRGVTVHTWTPVHPCRISTDSSYCTLHLVSGSPRTNELREHDLLQHGMILATAPRVPVRVILRSREKGVIPGRRGHWLGTWFIS